MDDIRAKKNTTCPCPVESFRHITCSKSCRDINKSSIRLSLETSIATSYLMIGMIIQHYKRPRVEIRLRKIGKMGKEYICENSQIHQLLLNTLFISTFFFRHS